MRDPPEKLLGARNVVTDRAGALTEARELDAVERV